MYEICNRACLVGALTFVPEKFVSLSGIQVCNVGCLIRQPEPVLVWLSLVPKKKNSIRCLIIIPLNSFGLPGEKLYAKFHYVKY